MVTVARETKRKPHEHLSTLVSHGIMGSGASSSSFSGSYNDFFFCMSEKLVCPVRNHSRHLFTTHYIGKLAWGNNIKVHWIWNSSTTAHVNDVAASHNNYEPDSQQKRPIFDQEMALLFIFLNILSLRSPHLVRHRRFPKTMWTLRSKYKIVRVWVGVATVMVDWLIDLHIYVIF